jgi:hypothetical protein|tara:strand:+ start:1190 stop:1366 length:177 start_codon:yes stop_codon:yes gene_type:complete
MNKKFPLEHLVIEETKEVLIVVNSAITAMGVGAISKQYFPGYTSKIVSKEYLINKKED